MNPTINDLIAFQAHTCPDAPAVFCPEGVFRYRDLMYDITAMVGELRPYPLRDSEPVVIVLPDCYVHLVLILALDRLNIPSATERRAPTKLAWQHEGPVFVFSNTKPVLDVPHTWIEISERWRPKKDDDAQAHSSLAFRDPIVRVILSSGSTGSPKAVQIRRGTLRARISEHIRDLGLGRDSRVMTLHPMSNGPCYWICMATLAAGGMLILLRSLDDRVENSRMLNATHISCSPAGLRIWIEEAKKIGPLSSVKVLETAGSYLPTQLAHQAQQVISPNVYSLYGATEVGRIAFSRIGATDTVEQEGGAGFVSPWCTVQIVDSLDNPLNFGEEGIIRVKTAGIIDSYFRSPEITAKYIRQGWFYPGDVGSISLDRFLRVRGRVDEVVNLGGHKINLIGVEEKLRTVVGVKDVSAFTVIGADQLPRVWAAIVQGEGYDESGAISVSKTVKVSRIIYMKMLPRNINGKVVKQKLAEAALKMPANEVRDGSCYR